MRKIVIILATNFSETSLEVCEKLVCSVGSIVSPVRLMPSQIDVVTSERPRIALLHVDRVAMVIPHGAYKIEGRRHIRTNYVGQAEYFVSGKIDFGQSIVCGKAIASSALIIGRRVRRCKPSDNKIYTAGNSNPPAVQSGGRKLKVPKQSCGKHAVACRCFWHLWTPLRGHFLRQSGIFMVIGYDKDVVQNKSGNKSSAGFAESIGSDEELDNSIISIIEALSNNVNTFTPSIQRVNSNSLLWFYRKDRDGGKSYILCVLKMISAGRGWISLTSYPMNAKTNKVESGFYVRFNTGHTEKSGFNASHISILSQKSTCRNYKFGRLLANAA